MTNTNDVHIVPNEHLQMILQNSMDALQDAEARLTKDINRLRSGGAKKKTGRLTVLNRERNKVRRDTKTLRLSAEHYHIQLNPPVNWIEDWARAHPGECPF